jgi:Tfp pilus assembly protein PilF
VDKLTGREFIYFNHAVKFRDIATCGPWCSGGIEFNFGVLGHSPTTAAPVAWKTRRNSDGSVSYFCGDTEKICGTVWQVEVRLKDGEDFFTTRTQWFNASELEEPYYQWMTAAYSARGNPKLEFPGVDWISHGGVAHPWPYDKKGRNLSVYAENAFGDAKSYHIVGGDERFFGIWWPEAGFGSYHENDHGEKYGRKIFMWAHSRAGGIWEDLLTDTDGQYIELQSGRVFNQPEGNTWKTPFKHPTFTPGRTDVFVERWGVMRDRSRIEKYKKAENQIERPVASPSDFDWNSVYARCIEAEQYLRALKNIRKARETVLKALERDPNYPHALELAAEIAYRRGEWTEARRHAARALSIDAYSPKANYIDALSAVKLGEDATALERFGLAAYSMEYRSAAQAAMAEISFRRGDMDEARRLAAMSLEANRLNINAARLQIEIARRRGDGAEADALTAEFERVWPVVGLKKAEESAAAKTGWRA